MLVSINDAYEPPQPNNRPSDIKQNYDLFMERPRKGEKKIPFN